MRRDTQAVLLLLVGATLLKVGIGGTYVRYVKPGLLPLILLSGAVLVGVAGVTLWRHLREAMSPADDAPANDPSVLAEPTFLPGQTRSLDPLTTTGAGALVRAGFGPTGESAAIIAGRAAAAHEGFDPEPEPLPELEPEPADESTVDEHPAGHDHDRSRVGWLLLVPALALLVFSPPALGSFQAARNGTALSIAATSDFAPIPAGDPAPLTLLDYAARAVYDQGRSLAGRNVMLTGFVIAGPRGEPYLTRLYVGCCAADGRPVKVGLTGDLPGGLTPDTWVEVIGVYVDKADRDPVNGEAIPYLSATTVRVIAPPDQQYET